MKRLAIPFVLLLALALPGCAAVSTLTTTITNPVSQVDIYRVKNTYAAALELADQYREYCWSRPYAALMASPISRPICQNRRAVVRAVQTTRPKAAAAIRAAEIFIRENPTLNAATAVAAAWKAVTNFQNAIPRVN